MNEVKTNESYIEMRERQKNVNYNDIRNIVLFVDEFLENKEFDDSEKNALRHSLLDYEFSKCEELDCGSNLYDLMTSMFIDTNT
jgi:hypothetical protein